MSSARPFITGRIFHFAITWRYYYPYALVYGNEVIIAIADTALYRPQEESVYGETIWKPRASFTPATRGITLEIPRNWGSYSMVIFHAPDDIRKAELDRFRRDVYYSQSQLIW